MERLYTLLEGATPKHLSNQVNDLRNESQPVGQSRWELYGPPVVVPDPSGVGRWYCQALTSTKE